MTTPPSETLLAELQAILGPCGFTRDQAEIAPWLTDWRGRFQGRSTALLSPASTAEVQAVVMRCAEHKTALVPQGGNSSLAGGATPTGDGSALLVSTRRMHAVRSASAEDNVLVAEAGVVLSAVHDAAGGIGRRFPLSLGAKGSATVGGLISTNAGGTQVLRFGPMRSLTLGLEAVLPDGSLYRGLSALRKDNRGYDLRHLLIGAEGTLGIVTAASLQLVALPGSRAVAWLGLASPEAALMLLRRIEGRLGESVESFELIPAAALQLVLERIPGTRGPLATTYAWNVLVELTGRQGAADAGESLASVLMSALEEGLALDGVVAASEAQCEALWRLRDSIAEAERQGGPALKHDISVPVAAMPGFMESARAAVEGRFTGSRVIAFGHLGDGNVHFNVQPPESVDSGQWLARKGPLVTALVYDMVAAAAGSISAEHGIGQLKVLDLIRTTDPARQAAQRAIKHALDPAGIMNPGKLFP